MKQPKVSPRQRQALHKMAAFSDLIRLPGGYWSTAGFAQEAGYDPERHAETIARFRSSELVWHVGIQTLEAIERRGWAKRVKDGNRSWARPFRITKLGRRVLAEVST